MTKLKCLDCDNSFDMCDKHWYSATEKEVIKDEKDEPEEELEK